MGSTVRTAPHPLSTLLRYLFRHLIYHLLSGRWYSIATFSFAFHHFPPYRALTPFLPSPSVHHQPWTNRMGHRHRIFRRRCRHEKTVQTTSLVLAYEGCFELYFQSCIFFWGGGDDWIIIHRSNQLSEKDYQIANRMSCLFYLRRSTSTNWILPLQSTNFWSIWNVWGPNKITHKLAIKINAALLRCCCTNLPLFIVPLRILFVFINSEREVKRVIRFLALTYSLWLVIGAGTHESSLSILFFFFDSLQTSRYTFRIKVCVCVCHCWAATIATNVFQVSSASKGNS